MYSNSFMGNDCYFQNLRVSNIKNSLPISLKNLFFFLLHLRSREGRSTSKVEHHRISQAYMLYSRAYKRKVDD